MCVCVTCVNNCERAHTSIRIQYLRWEKHQRMLEISKKRNWKKQLNFKSFVQFEYEIYYFCSILICLRRLYVKMNILFFFNNLLWSYISHIYWSEKIELEYMQKFLFRILLYVYMCVSHIALECLHWIVYCIVFI